MFGVPRADFATAINRQYAAQGMANKSDESLIEMVRQEMATARAPDFYEALNMDVFGDISHTHPFCQALGASDVLRARHGQEYVLHILGLRKPKTLAERARRIFKGEYPKAA